MTRATFTGHDPARDDGLRQIPVNVATRPDPQMLDRFRQGVAAHVAHTNLQDAIRALYRESAA
jgi:hypothetical protein